MGNSAFFLRALLKKRCRKGKEDPARLGERMGQAGKPRPHGPLIWFHAASVGEAQSTLILLSALKERYPEISILVTTGTVTSATVMEQRLPRGAIHQYYPLDHPRWVASFLDHWQPQLALWMESELWPNMLAAIRQRGIPAALVNARLSPSSFRRWKRMAPIQIAALLEVFSVCLAQTAEDGTFFKELGMQNVIVSDNLKYSAAPLPYSQSDHDALKNALGGRPFWLYASTHDDEEEIACRIHRHLVKQIPELLTVIAPRHPERRETIYQACDKYGLNIAMRGENRALPTPDDGLYIADTMGELGLFYKLAPIACIGRSFSRDGGGGHSPIEAAKYECAILHGPHVQNLARIYEEFDTAGAAIALKTEQDFQKRLEKLLSDEDGVEALQNKAYRFVSDKSKVIDTVMQALTPLIDMANHEPQSDNESGSIPSQKQA